MTGYGAPELPDHMNGRIYDLLLGRFLSADLIVQNPASLQCFNRYSYVMNNPLSLTDPSGFSAETEEQRKARLAAEANARGQIISERGILGYIVAGESAQSMISNAGNSAVSQMASSDTTPMVVFRPPNRLGISIDLERNDGAADLQDETGLLEERIDGVDTAEDTGGPTGAISHDSNGQITEITVFLPARLPNRRPEAKSPHERGDYSDMQIPLADLSGSVVAFGVTKAAETAAAYGDDAAKVAGLSRASYALGKASLAFSVWGTVDGLVEGGGGPRAVVQAAVSTAIIGFSVSPPPLPLISIGLSAANIFLGDYFYRQVDEDW